MSAQTLGERQPDAVAHDLALVGLPFEIVEYLEAVEDIADVLGLDTLARVPDPHGRTAGLRTQRDADVSACGRIFIGIGNQVVEDFLQCPLVAHEDDLLRREVDAQVDAPLLVDLVEIVGNGRNQLRDVDHDVAGRVMPGLDPPELHQLADQALHARRVVLHDADMLGDVGREAVTVEQLLARPVDQRQGVQNSWAMLVKKRSFAS